MAANGFSIAPQNLGSFKCLDGTYAVWASTREERLPATQWQFRYAPLVRVAVVQSALPSRAGVHAHKDNRGGD
jgi:hypothetical protein